MTEKKFMHGKTLRKKFMHKMGRILIVDKNYSSSRKVFQNAPIGIRACQDFQNFPAEEFPRAPTKNAQRRTQTKITEKSKNKPECYPG